MLLLFFMKTTKRNVYLKFLRVFYSVGGVKVSIVASQAIDPGSIPGRRKFLISIIFGNLRRHRGIITLQNTCGVGSRTIDCMGSH